MHLAEKGRDPRDYTLIAFGGAGPVHAWNLARLLKIRRILVPLGAGVASALGFLVAPPATDMVRSHVGRLGRLDWAVVNGLFAEMAEAGRALLAEAGADPATIILRPSADMRHVGQGFEISVPLPGISLSDADIPAIRENFFDSYRTRFGRMVEDQPIEALSWRLACAAPGQDIRIRLGGTAAPASGAADAARRAARHLRGPWRPALPGLRPLRAAPGHALRRAGPGRGTGIHLRHRPGDAGLGGWRPQPRAGGGVMRRRGLLLGLAVAPGLARRRRKPIRTGR